jgi:AbrB family looped-hinge helix DNA binding protein
MQTAVTKRGQTVIPAAIRKRYHIQEGDRLVWLDDGQTIRVVPVPADPIRALRGSGRGERLLERLLATRREDRNRVCHPAERHPPPQRPGVRGADRPGVAGGPALRRDLNQRQRGCASSKPRPTSNVKKGRYRKIPSRKGLSSQ